MKKYYERKLFYSKTFKKQISDLVESFGLTIKFSEEKEAITCMSPLRKMMIININHYDTISELLSAIFHELVHFICFEEGIYKNYHQRRITTETLDYYLRYGIRAERFVDKKAKQIMSSYFPDIPFYSGYQEKGALDWYHGWILSHA